LWVVVSFNFIARLLLFAAMGGRRAVPACLGTHLLDRMAAAAESSAAMPSSAGYLNGVAHADSAHTAKLAGVARQVKTRPAGKRLSMRKVSKSHTPHNKAFKRECHLVDVSELDSILRCVPQSDVHHEYLQLARTS
jgi:hypothetical protein